MLGTYASREIWTGAHTKLSIFKLQRPLLHRLWLQVEHLCRKQRFHKQRNKEDSLEKNYATSSGKKDYNITTVGNLYAKDFQSRSGSAEYFIPSDHYTLKAYDSKLVEEVVTNEENGAGATLDITSTANSIDNISATNSELPIDITYYNIDGTKLNAPQPGFNIAKMLYADGRVASRKVKK